jgi:hypothetical protein
MNPVNGSMNIPKSPTDMVKVLNANPISTSPMSFVGTGPPTPAQVALNYLLYTMYSLVGTLIYYPSFLVNIPESTLEHALPKQDLCMKMGFSKRTCQKKIKCLLRKCDYLDDPDGYKLDKQYETPCKRKERKRNLTKNRAMVGGNNETRKYRGKKNNWGRYLTKHLKQKMRQEYQKNILSLLIGKKRKNKVNTKKYYGGNRNAFNRNTCRNNKTKILCHLNNEHVVSYKMPSESTTTLNKSIKYLGMFGGDNKSQNPVEDEIKQIVFDLIQKHNADLHKLVTENPEHVSKIIEDVKKKFPAVLRIINMFPSKIKSFVDNNSSRIGSFISKLNVNQFTSLTPSIESLTPSIESLTPSIGKNPESPSTTAQSSETEVSSEEADNEKNYFIKRFFVEKIKTESLFKLAIVIKIMEKVLEMKKITITDKSKITYPEKSKGTNITFPWNFNDPEMCLSDRIKCLSAHITQTKIEENTELYNKCFVCKHCTLRNTASTVWGNVIKGVLSGNKNKQFEQLINKLYGVLIKHVNTPFMTGEQYYLTTLISLQMAIQDLDIEQINTSFKTAANSFKLKELILGIPAISIQEQSAFNDDIEQIKTDVHLIRELGIFEEINGIYYESLMRKFFEIEHHNYEEKLNFLKKIAYKNYELLYVKNENNNNRRIKGVYEKFYNNSITSEEMKHFSHFSKGNPSLDYVNSWNYGGLSEHLHKELEEQYNFLLDQNNFKSPEAIKISQSDLDAKYDHLLKKKSISHIQQNNSGPMSSDEKEKFQDLRLLRDVALKMF